MECRNAGSFVVRENYSGRRSYFVAFYIVKNNKSISFAIYIVE